MSNTIILSSLDKMGLAHYAALFNNVYTQEFMRVYIATNDEVLADEKAGRLVKKYNKKKPAFLEPEPYIFSATTCNMWTIIWHFKNGDVIEYGRWSASLSDHYFEYPAKYGPPKTREIVIYNPTK